MRVIVYKTKKGGSVAKVYKTDSAATRSIKALKGKLKPIQSMKTKKSKSSKRRSSRW